MGLQQKELSYFKLARYFFPFDKEIAVSDAIVSIRSRINTKDTYQALKKALKYDPYSIEMLSMYIQFANIYGSKSETRDSYLILKQIGPNTNNFKELTKLNLPNLKGL